MTSGHKTTTAFLGSFLLIIQLVILSSSVFCAPHKRKTQANPKASKEFEAFYYSGDQRGSLDPEISLEDLHNRGGGEGINLSSAGKGVLLKEIPKFSRTYKGQYGYQTARGETVLYTVNPQLQESAQKLLNQVRSAHAAIVAMNPKTGEILAIAGKSRSIPDLPLHGGFPAASLFKIVTAAAAVEKAGINEDSRIFFRGGTYALTQWNYLPNARLDKRSLRMGEALGKSCNPVFGRIGLKYLTPSILRDYADNFGFNTKIAGDFELPKSGALIPHDAFELSRTAAGFGDVTLSPLHAAAITSALGNGGLLPRPYIVDKILSKSGETSYIAKPEALTRIARRETVKKVLEMMEYTTTIGTSRKEFMKKKRPVLGSIRVAAKTGTLRGRNPWGLNNWFIATAPMNNPEIALAVIVVDPGFLSMKASKIGRIFLQDYFKK